MVKDRKTRRIRYNKDHIREESTMNVEAPTQKPAAEKKETKPAEIRTCLSGSGQPVLGKKSKFAMGGDAKLKSKLIREVIDGKVDPTVSKEARDYAKQAWPKLVEQLANGSHEQVSRARKRAEAATKPAEAPKAEKNPN